MQFLCAQRGADASLNAPSTFRRSFGGDIPTMRSGTARAPAMVTLSRTAAGSTRRTAGHAAPIHDGALTTMMRCTRNGARLFSTSDAVDLAKDRRFVCAKRWRTVVLKEAGAVVVAGGAAASAAGAGYFREARSGRL